MWALLSNFFLNQRTSPMTNMRLTHLELVPNVNLRQAIEAYLEVSLRRRPLYVYIFFCKRKKNETIF